MSTLLHIEDIDQSHISPKVGFLAPLEKQKYLLKTDKKFYRITLTETEEVRVEEIDNHRARPFNIAYTALLEPLKYVIIVASNNNPTQSTELLIQDICCYDNKPQQLSYKNEKVENQSSNRYVHFRYQRTVLNVVKDLSFLKNVAEKEFARLYLSKAYLTQMPGLTIEHVPASTALISDLSPYYDPSNRKKGYNVRKMLFFANFIFGLMFLYKRYYFSRPHAENYEVEEHEDGEGIIEEGAEKAMRLIDKIL